MLLISWGGGGVSVTRFYLNFLLSLNIAFSSFQTFFEIRRFALQPLAVDNDTGFVYIIWYLWQDRDKVSANVNNFGTDISVKNQVMTLCKGVLQDVDIANNLQASPFTTF